MDDRFKQLPSALAKQTKIVRLGSTGIPALLAHPDWRKPAPTVIWMHGRTADKTLDNGRYLRWIRAGIAACAIDLPGHGERLEPERQQPTSTPGVIEEAVGEIDHIIEALADPQWNSVFDTDRLAIGGMSAGGMATLRRLCDTHLFTCAAVESTAGNLRLLYSQPAWPDHDHAQVARIDPMQHLAHWRPIPLLVLHSEADRIVPLECMTTFLEALHPKYQAAHMPNAITLKAWPTTGAPDEHSGFGRVASEAKTLQVEFLTKHLRPALPNS